MEWFLTGVLFAFFNAITMLVNQYYRLDGHFLSGVRGVGVAFLALPFLFLVDMPRSSLFWILIFAEGLLSSFFNSRLYSSSALYGAGATSRIGILAVVFGVGFWWIFKWENFLELCRYWPVLIGIVASLAAIITGACLMVKSDGVESASGSHTKMSAFRYMMPAVVVLALMMIVRKQIMETTEFFSAATYYCVAAISLSGIINLIVYARRNGAVNLFDQFTKNGFKVWSACAVIAVSSAITIFCGNISSFKSPDPAYVTALTLLSPVVIMFVNRIFGVRDNFSKTAIIVMFSGVGALIYFADIPLPPPTSSVFGK